jgi:hypothetical protein
VNPELATEREPEPEARAFVVEELTEVEAVSEADHWVQDPQRPHCKHKREQPLVPGT